MPAQNVEYNPATGDITGTRGDGEPFTFNVADLPGGSNWNQQKLNVLTRRTQDELDTRVSVNDLQAVGDPDANLDDAALAAKYGAERAFKDGPNTIVYRATIVTWTFDGTHPVPSIRKAIRS